MALQPRARSRTVALVVLLVALSLAVPLAPVAATSDPGADGVLTVDDDGGAEFRDLTAAANASTDGDTISVAPGAYSGPVVLDENVTLVGTGDVVLSRSASVVIPAGSHAAPTIEGITVTGGGLLARGTAGDWRLAGVRFVGASVAADDSTGNWTVEDATFVDVGRSRAAVQADRTSGAWLVRNVTVRDSPGAVDGSSSTGDWTVADVRAVGTTGVMAYRASGDWTIRRLVVTGGRAGVHATFASGNWTVEDSVLTGNRFGVDAASASNASRVVGSVLAGNRNRNVRAVAAGDAVDATGNWWGSAGPGEADCSGNVTCADPLAEPPEIGIMGGPPPLDGVLPPLDPDGDGVFEDVDGDGAVTVIDVAILLDEYESPTARRHAAAFDVQGDGDLDVLDVAAFLDR
jgi:hypothetical protein